jgi:hypothetical protein
MAKERIMTKQLRLTLALAVLGLLAVAATALAGNVKIGPAKGASYNGVIRGFNKLTIKVAANGKTAKVSLPSAPAFCQGGASTEIQHSKPAKIKSGGLTTTISYTIPDASKPFATVTIKGNFYTFPGERPVFQGTAKSTFNKAAECSGQESFQATKG